MLCLAIGLALGGNDGETNQRVGMLGVRVVERFERGKLFVLQQREEAALSVLPPSPVLPPLPRDAPSRQGVRETADEEAAGAPDISGGDGSQPLGSSGDVGAIDDARPVLSASRYTVLGEIVAAYPWPINEAFRIVDCESSWNPDAVSWAGSYGLMQIHSATWAPVFPEFWERWADPEWNVATAWEIYKRAGYSFAPWDC